MSVLKQPLGLYVGTAVQVKKRAIASDGTGDSQKRPWSKGYPPPAAGFRA